MNDALMYFLKVNVAIALFNLFFRLAFYNDTFWKTRRFYLVFSILLSVVYPFISFTGWLEKQETLQAMVSYVQLQDIVVSAKPTSMISVENVLLAAYALVSLFFLVKMIVQLASIVRWKLKGNPQLLQGTKIMAIDKAITPFSFFNTIFINPALHNEHETNQILTHELTHARQMHSMDVLLSEMLTVACWINPAAWLLKREIRQNLEFLADNKVLESGFDSKNYQYHLLQLSYQTPDLKLINKFNVSPLKKRITMMNQQKTNKAGLLKYSLIVPLALALILSSNAQTIVNSAKRMILVSNEPAVIDTKTNSLILGSATLQDAKPTEQQPGNQKIYNVVEKMPVYPGGDQSMLQYINSNLRYPVDAQEKGIQGKVIIRFVVNESGKVENAEVIRTLYPSLDAEGIRVVKSLPDFIPGEQNGKKVAVWYTMPITFKLDDGPANSKKIYSVVEKMPQFPGGEQSMLQYINSNLRYPVDAQEKGIQGKVIIRFAVNESGKVENIEVIRSLYPSLDAEGIRVIKSFPDFIPGEQNGEKVAVYYTLPITFRLDGSSTSVSSPDKNSIVVVAYGKQTSGLVPPKVKPFDQYNPPVIIVDGKIQPASFDINSINPTTIEKIDVLKPDTEAKKAELVAKYGENGANGVVSITRKKY